MSRFLTKTKGWWSMTTLTTLYNCQKKNGVSGSVMTMIAAHRQWADIEALLGILKKMLKGEKLTEEDAEVLTDVRKRHKKYDLDRQGERYEDESVSG